MWRHPILQRLIGPVVGLAVCGLILAVAHKLSRDIDYHALVHALRQTRRSLLWESLAATAVSYVALIGRDVAALRYVGARVPLRATLLASFCGSALGNAVGFGALTGGAMRYRIYGAAGITPEQVARLMVFITVSFAVGLAFVAAVGTVLAEGAVGRLLGLPPLLVRGGGVVTLLAVAALVAVCARRRAPLRFGRWTFALPDGRLALGQLVLTALDLVVAGAALWVLLPGQRMDFATFSAVFAVATALGVISHVPGGIGVFEAVVVFALGRHVSPTLVAAALLAYRGIYFGLPLLLAAALLALLEVRRFARGSISGTGERVLDDATQLAPIFLSVITFAIGVMLLVSGATPAFATRLDVLHHSLPLWAIETSNFVASLTGVVLLFVARGLFHRLDGAWWLAVVIAAANLALSLAKGLAYGESVVIGCLILLLLATRHQFRRPTSFLRQPFTVDWFAAIGIVIVAVGWILVFAFRDVQYTHELWWQFELDAQAPRAFRAILGATVMALAGALWQLLRPASGQAALPTQVEMAQAKQIIAGQKCSEAMLALMGDKSFLFSASGRSMLMYAKHGRSWVALYDPVGPREEWPELIWNFVELADAHGGRVAFYEVRPDNLPLYLDAGLKVMKLGEEARIVLAEFTTDGPTGGPLRQVLKRGEREGFELEILAPGDSERVLDQLVSISDGWLASRKIHEKAFSVAAFGRDFVASQFVALLRQAGTPVAFVTVMTSGLRHEATAGLMRHTPEASRYAMEYIFIRLGLYLKEAGFEVFSLGMAPLAGLGRTPLSSSWHRFGGLLWEHGGRLYRFQGLRAFKNKFHPLWEPRYLAASGSIGPLLSLTDVMALARGSRGARRVGGRKE